MTKHVLVVHHVTLGPRKIRATQPSSTKLVSRPLSTTDDETDDAPTTAPLAGSSTASQQINMIQYSSISDYTLPPSPVPQPIVVIHFDTDYSDTQELIIPHITNVRTVTAITSLSSPIILSDTENTTPAARGPVTNLGHPDNDAAPPPMKKFCTTLEPSPLLKEELIQILVNHPSALIPTWTPLDQTSTSIDDLQTTMAQIESVWEARINAHITDQLAEHDSAMAKKFADQDKKSAAKFNVLESNWNTNSTTWKPP